MPLHTTEAIVLRTYALGETDRIVVMLTRDRGKKRGIAKAARRSRRRFGGALEPLTHVRVAYVEREQRELVHWMYAEPIQSPMTAQDPDGLTYSAYFADLLDEWSPQDHSNQKGFRLASAALTALSAGVAASTLARYFEFWLLRLEGVFPSLALCGACGTQLTGGAALSGEADSFLCLDCAPGGQADVSPSSMQFLRDAIVRTPEALKTVTLAADAQVELARLHRALLARYLDREPRSLRVLRAMAAPVLARPADMVPPAFNQRG